MPSDAFLAVCAEVVKLAGMQMHPERGKAIAQSGIIDRAVMVLANAIDEELGMIPAATPVPKVTTTTAAPAAPVTGNATP